MNRSLLSIGLILLFAFSAFAGDIQITSPSKDQDVYTNSVLTIRWNPGNTAKFVNIEYSIGENFYLLQSSVPNSGEFDWDLTSFKRGRITIKVSDASNPRNYSVSPGVNLQYCTVEALFRMPSSLCTNGNNVISNQSSNATMFEWSMDGKIIGTDPDLNLPLSGFQDFKLTLKASNQNCYDVFYVDVYAASIGTGSEPCGNPVIQEMVIIDHSEHLRMMDYYPIELPQGSKILAFQLTHQLPEFSKLLAWDWRDKAIDGFTPDCIDFANAKSGEFNVTWTSPDPNGSDFDGSLYTLQVESGGAQLDIELAPKTRLGKQVRMPDIVGSTKLMYKSINAVSKNNPSSKLKTTGTILTTDGIIILQ